MVKNAGWCVHLLNRKANEKAFDKMLRMQIKAQS